MDAGEDADPAIGGVAHQWRKPAVRHHRGAPARPPRHPWAPDPADLPGIRGWVADRTRPTAVDVFAGAGGLSLGLHQAGFDVLVGADNDAWAMETHGANLPGLTWTGDLADPTEFLQTLDVWGIESVDLVAGGVPCQPFSRAGRSRMRQLVRSGERGGHDSRADLWESFIAVVRRLRPRAVLVENVPDLPRWDDGSVLLSFYESLRDLGYNVDARIMDGFRHGVPQHRQRLILLGLRDGRPSWPEPEDVLVSLRDAIGDLPIIPRAQRTEELPYDASRQTDPFQAEMRSGLTGDAAHVVWDHICRDVRGDDMEAFALLSEGQTYVDLPERLRRYRSDVFTDKYKRLSWNELSRTITAHIAKDGYWYIHPDQHRTLSIREAARIQTFPDRFRFAGTQTHRYRQIGNAVPVRLGEVVGRQVLENLRAPSRTRSRYGDLRAPLLGWHAARPASGRRSRVAGPWIVLMAELALRRMGPAEGNEMQARLVVLAPRPSALTHDPARSLSRLEELGLGASAGLIVEAALYLDEHHGGLVPDDDLLLREVPGVGEGVCQAVLCFGFGRRAVLLDRHTARVTHRVTGRGDQRRYQLRLDLHRLAGLHGPDAPFNTALLDLAREVCTAGRPACPVCPLRGCCAEAGGATGGAVQLSLEEREVVLATEESSP